MINIALKFHENVGRLETKTQTYFLALYAQLTTFKFGSSDNSASDRSASRPRLAEWRCCHVFAIGTLPIVGQQQRCRHGTHNLPTTSTSASLRRSRQDVKTSMMNCNTCKLCHLHRLPEKLRGHSDCVCYRVG